MSEESERTIFRFKYSLIKLGVDIPRKLEVLSQQDELELLDEFTAILKWLDVLTRTEEVDIYHRLVERFKVGL